MKHIGNVRSWIGTALAGWLGLALIRNTLGRGKIFIIGAGNSANRFYVDQVSEELAETLAGHAATPAITDALLAETFDAIVQRAREGDLQAALVLYRVAELQRKITTPPDVYIDRTST